MAQLIYEITGDISGLQSAINQASNLIRDASNQSSQIKVADISPQIVAGVAALDQLDKKLLVITGNAALFGDSLKSQSNQVSAYQGAINSLLANGFDPMDGDVQRLKQHVDALTSSLTAASNVRAPGRDFNNDPGFSPGILAVTQEPATASASLIRALNEQLASGIITIQEYNQALLSANSTTKELAQVLNQTEASYLNNDEAIATTGAAVDSLINKEQSLIGILDALDESFDAGTIKTRAYNKTFDATIAQIDSVREQIRTLIAEENKLIFTNGSIIPSASLSNNPQQAQALLSLNEQLASGAITVQEYNQALLGANSTLNTLGQSATQAGAAFENEIGLIAGLKLALADLNSVRLNTLVEGDLPRLNAEIQETEIEIARLSNIGKQGFDSMGNAIRGVSVSSVNGQLVALSNNLFGARQISRDLVRTLDAGSIQGFVKALGLLAVDFLFFAQNAQFARTSTIGATAAIAVEGEVAAGSALSTGALGAAFASLLTPTSLIVLGIAAAGAAFIAFERSQKTATQAATEHLKAIRQQKQALDDYLTTLNPVQQVEASASQSYAASTLKLNELVFAVKNNTGALFDGQTALEDLQRLYPNFFANLDEAATKTDKFTAATNGARDSIIALGKFTAANKLAEQSIETATSSQVAADSLLPALVKERTALIALQQQAQKTVDARKLLAAQAGTSILDPDVLVQEQKIAGLLDQINKYNQIIAEANTKTKAFFDIANQNAPAAGLISKFKGPKDIVDQFDSLKQKLDEITQKSSSLAGNTGITGYAAEVAAIVKQFTSLNNEIATFTIAVNKAFDKGALTGGERNRLLAGLPAPGAISTTEDSVINQARIKNAQTTADAIQKINDQFGIKTQAGFNEELSRVKKLYDSVVQAANENALSLQQIEQNKQKAINAANGNPQILANIERTYQAEIIQAQDATAKIAAAQADLLPAIEAVDEKYIQQETETYGRIIDIANQAFQQLASGEEARTDKINLEADKRITKANQEFDKLRNLAKAAQLPQSSTDNINSIQARVNVLIDASRFQQVSEEISKNFASAMQSAVNGFVSNFYASLTGLGQARQDIDNKYFSQLAAATDQSTINQINNLKRLEQESTTSFGAIFSSLISKFNQTFNESILNSFTKQLTENLGKTLLTPTAKQLQISPEEKSAQNVATLLKGAGEDLATQIKQAGIEFANGVKSASVNPLSNTGVDAGGNLVPLNSGVGSLSGDFSNTIQSSADGFSSQTTDAAAKAAGNIVGGSTTAESKITNSGTKFSASVAKAAAALSIAGGLISGATSPTSSVGQGIGGALSGAGAGALVGTALGGPVLGTAIGAAVGLVSGLLSASKARKQEELQQKQLEQQKVTNELLARQNALAYTTAIIGRMTTQGIVTGVDINAFGELTAKISGKDLQFILGRANNGR